MKFKRYEKVFTLFTENKTLEINWDYWNPRNYIGYQKSFELWLTGDHSPHFSFHLCLICVSLSIEWYDNRHK